MELPTSISKIFNPREYLDFYYQNTEANIDKEVNEFLLDTLHDFCQDVPERETVVIFGSGPTIFANISASAKFKRIVCAEYTEANRIELQKWLQNDKDKFDWSESFKYVAMLENRSKEDWKAVEERVRSTTTDVIPCNVLKDPVMEHPCMPFDAVITTLCLEEASIDYASFKSNIKRLVGALNSGGHFFIAAMKEMSCYTVQKQMIKTFAVTEEQLKEALISADLDVIKLSLFTKVGEHDKENSSGVISIHAQKK